MGSGTAGVELTSIGTAASVQTSNVRSGSYSFLVNPSTQNSTSAFQFINPPDATGIVYYARAYIYITALPASGAVAILGLASSTANGNIHSAISLTSSGTLRIVSPSSSVTTDIGTGDSAALSLNTWYCVEISSSWNGTTRTSAARLNGVQFSTATGGNASFTYIRFGAYANGVNNTCTIYFDDLAVNDNTGSLQNSWPGEGKIIHLMPNAAGDSNTFATQTGGTAGAANNYTRVNEIPPNDATSFNGSITLNEEDMFNVANSGIGASDTVNIVHVGFRFRGSLSSSVPTAKLQIRASSGGTTTQSGGTTPDTTSWRTNTTDSFVHNYPLTLHQDPTGTNWSQSTLDTMQIGYKITTGNSFRFDVTTVWAVVDYTPAPPPPVLTSAGAFFAML